MRPRPLSRSQPPRTGKIDKKQRLNGNNKNSKPTKNLKTDESILKKSVKTCINGLDKVIKVLEEGSEEVIDYLSNECSIIYECRVCLNLFRSLANFIAHKRVYCRKKFTDLQKNYDGQIEERMASVSADFQKGILSTRSTSKRDLVNFLDALPIKKATAKEISPDLFAIELDATKEALFHCFRHEGKQCSEERSATVGPDGLIVGTRMVNGTSNDVDVNANNSAERTSSPSDITASTDDHLTNLPCPNCPKKFGSDKSLQAHTKAFHNLVIRTCYACPCCKKYLANTWSVYRHLSKVHKKTNEQIRRLRPQILKKQMTPEEDNNKPKPQTQNTMASPLQEVRIKTIDEEKTLDDSATIQSDPNQCFVCGRRYDRRMAMLAHAQFCREKNAAVPCHGVTITQPSEPLLKISDSPEMVSKRPRLDSPSPPSSTPAKSGIEVRTYYEKNNKPATPTTSADSSPTVLADTLHLKPTALALLASMPKARVVLTKTPVPIAVATRVNMSPSPPHRATTSREFSSPRAEDIISRYRGRQNLNSQIFERRDSLSPSNNKVAVESVYCSDTEDSSSGCEYVFGAKDIANCIGTVDSIADFFPTTSSSTLCPPDLNDKTATKSNQFAHGSSTKGIFQSERLTRIVDRLIKKEPNSDEERTEFVERNKTEEVVKIIKQELYSDVEGEEEIAEGRKSVLEVIDSQFENEPEDGEEDNSRCENGQEDSSIPDVASSSDGEENAEDKNNLENSEEDEEEEEEDEEDEVESEGDIDEEDSDDSEEDDDDDDDDDSSSEDSHKAITREDSLIKERALNGLLKNCNHLRNGITTKYAISWIYRKINSYIDGSKKKCLLCLKTFHRLNLVRRHVATHLNIYNFKCMIDTCNFKCFLRVDMLKHLLKVHKKKDIRKNRNIYMKRITNDMIPVDDNGLPCVPLSSLFPRQQSTTILNQLNTTRNEIVPNSKLSSVKRTLNMVSGARECDSTNSVSNSIDLEVDNSDVTVTNRGVGEDDDDSTLSAAGDSLKEFHTTNMQMYDTDLDELIINPDADSSDDKLRALMMQVIFGSGNIRPTQCDQISDCESDTAISTSTVPTHHNQTTTTTVLESTSSAEVGGVSTQ